MTKTRSHRILCFILKNLFLNIRSQRRQRNSKQKHSSSASRSNLNFGKIIPWQETRLKIRRQIKGLLQQLLTENIQTRK